MAHTYCACPRTFCIRRRDDCLAYAGYALGLCSYLMAAVVLNHEMDSFVPANTWLVRMPLITTFAAELAKLRGVVLIMDDEERSYFFWLFVVLTTLQGLLAVWAGLSACPRKEYLQLPWGSLHTGYEVLFRAHVLVSGQRVCTVICLSTLRQCTNQCARYTICDCSPQWKVNVMEQHLMRTSHRRVRKRFWCRSCRRQIWQ